MELKQNIKEWIVKTGYPFELWTESKLSKYGYSAYSSTFYFDSENSLYRELDLEAIKYWSDDNDEILFELYMVIECKKSDKPFILLENTNRKPSVLSMGEYLTLDDAYCGLAINNPNSILNLPENSGVGFKLIQGFVNGDEVSNRAINTLVKSYNFRNKELAENIESSINQNMNSILLPILLIDAPFYAASIDSMGEVELRDICCAKLYTNTHLSHTGTPFPIIVVKKDFLESFLESLDRFGENNLLFLEQNPMYNIKNFDIRKLVIVPNKTNHTKDKEG